MAVMCMRCREAMDPDKSAYVYVITEFEWGWGKDATKTSRLGDDSCAVHLNGDRECTRTISGYQKLISKKLDISVDCVREVLGIT